MDPKDKTTMFNLRIRATDLMLGNWVQVLGVYKDSYVKAGLVQVDAELLQLCEQGKIQLLAIEINKKILADNGLTYKHGSKVRMYDVDGYFYIRLTYERTYVYSRSGDALTTIKYIHQLQNLLNALNAQISIKL